MERIDRDEIDLGEPVEAEIRPNPGFVLAIRLDNDDARRLFAIANQQSRSSLEVAAELLRESVRTAMPEVPPRRRQVDSSARA